MAAWGDPKIWEGLVSGRTCPICTDGGPTHVIAEMDECWLTMAADPAPALPGACALFLKRHAVELHELSASEAANFMSAVQRVAAALQEATGAVKINYEVHGNTIPHLHMHFFPRYRGDPFERGPIDPRREGSAGHLERHRAIRSRLIAALG
jgi:diadenosine tetraphosphate (Ap4A) HIT family hydrolase